MPLSDSTASQLFKPGLLGFLTGQRWLVQCQEDRVLITEREQTIEMIDDPSVVTVIPSFIGYQVKSNSGGFVIKMLPKRVAQGIIDQQHRALARKHANDIRIHRKQIAVNLQWFLTKMAESQSAYIQSAQFDDALENFGTSSLPHLQEIDEKQLSARITKNNDHSEREARNILNSPEKFRGRMNSYRLQKQLKLYEKTFLAAGLTLTNEQAEAAMGMEKANLLEAGAGSGKTAVIVARALYAVAADVARPEHILCLAYNAKAAGELRERIDTAFAMAGVSGASSILVQTFHAFGLGIIQSAMDNQMTPFGTDKTVKAQCDKLFANAIGRACKGPKEAQIITTLNDIKQQRQAHTKGNSTDWSFRMLNEAEAIYRNSRYYFSEYDPDADLLRHCDKLGLTQGEAHRLKGFTELVRAISAEYREQMVTEGLLDFSDMTVLACHILRQIYADERPDLLNDPVFKRHFVVVDEFQDISHDRAELIRRFVQLNDNSVLFGVGDDWQSINRFSGSDIGLFTQFEAFFGDTDRKMLTRTFRSCRGIAETARRFIVANPQQSQKPIKQVANEAVADVVQTVSYNNKQDVAQAITKTIHEWLAEEVQGFCPSVMIIDRHNLAFSRALSEKTMACVKAEFDGRASITLSTAHSAKGLEADYVLIAGLVEGGFPSERVPDFWKSLYLPREESSISYADERRLFYVALTRARKKVALLAPQLRPSCFVGETEKIFKQVAAA